MRVRSTIGTLLLVGTMVVGMTGVANAAGPSVESYNSGGVQTDEFAPGDDLYIRGSGFEAGKTYNVFVVPYTDGVHVDDDDDLFDLGGPGLVDDVTTDAAGEITLTKVWTVAGTPCTYYEIVVNYAGRTYDEGTDALDAVALGDAGFHIYPELPTIALLSLGLIGVASYIGLRRRARNHSVS